MIQYSLICENRHTFDAWFHNAAAYDEQERRGIVTCPVCNVPKVEKAIMAPALTRSGEERVAVTSGHPQQREIIEKLRVLRHKLVSEADYVGDRFAEEARKIHFKEVEGRGIYGEATRDDVAGLIEDGVEFMPLPILPDEHN